jgi:tartrate-resistant acid phosphatase type 5
MTFCFKFVKIQIALLLLIVFEITSIRAMEASFRFAVIGDYGDIQEKATSVSVLVKSWAPHIILTTGDNNYPCGAEETIDKNIGSLYSKYIFPYKGSYAPSPIQQNRFFPCLGNHDFDTDLAAPYLNYFTLPGNGRYYDFVKGDIHFFALSSDIREPDGTNLESLQAQWLKKQLNQSKTRWKVVYFHHPVYSSKNNFYNKNGERTIDFPFSEWGASIVINGHAHVYERFNIGGTPYIINGLGGKEAYEFCDDSSESIIKYNSENIAMLAEIINNKIVFRVINIFGIVIDEFSI